MLAFDSHKGQLIAESGVILGDIIATFLPRGWFPIVTPGTKFVTLGGMIAADVHGKNHHKEGSFGAYVNWIDVMGADGEVRRCSRTKNTDLFECTLGGMGLSGIILRAEIRLRSVETAWVNQMTIPASNINEAIEVFEQSLDVTYSVAWIDCLGTGSNLGRSLVMLGEHTKIDELPPDLLKKPLIIPKKHKVTIPFDFPAFVLNRFSVKAFNALYYQFGARKSGQQLVDWDSYFYPLDSILRWNRIYGPKGFAQFQCVIPLNQSQKGLPLLLEATSNARAGSFLAVLKRFGPQDSCFSFPMEGYTLALDFQINSKVMALLDALDRITIEYGGRFYLAKDSRMNSSTLRATDGRVDQFIRMRNESGWREQFISSQSERLSI